MAEMKTMPVFKCKRCGRPVTVKHLSTNQPDEQGAQLFKWMKKLGEIVLCEDCRMAYNYYAAEGRMQDFDASPAGMLLTVDHHAR